jgi:hypothetical protein
MSYITGINLSVAYLPSAPIPTVPIPNLALESLSDSSGLKSGAYSGRLIFLCRIYEHSGASLINNSISNKIVSVNFRRHTLKRGPGAPGLRGRPPCKLQLAASTPPGLAQIHAEQLDGTDEIFQLLFYILRPHI